jgi:uncharacterized cupredoxin-like copper-binding protein
MFAAVAVALLAGCGDSSDSETTTTTVAGSSGTTAAGATSTTAASGTSTTAAGGSATTAAGSVAVTLNPTSVEASTSLKAGAVTFAIKNGDSRNQHEFVVMKGKFAELAKTSNGAVDETKLAAGALVGRTDKIAGGGSTTATYTLAAGNYVLLCNINSGPNSHAAEGQRLDVTVA